MSSATVPLPRIWRILFLLELPLVAATVAWWLLQPRGYLDATLGPGAGGAVPLVYLYAGVVFTTVVYFYARVLLRPEVHLPTFRAYQEALLLGDVWIVVVGLWTLAQGVGTPEVAFASIAMATLWGTLRGVYLLRHVSQV